MEGSGPWWLGAWDLCGLLGCSELDLGAGWRSLPLSRLLLGTAQVSVVQAWLQWALLPGSMGFHAWDTGFPASPGSQLCLLQLSLAQCLSECVAGFRGWA